MPLKVFCLIFTLIVLVFEPSFIVANNVYSSAFDILSNKYTNNVTLNKVKDHLQYNSNNINPKYDDKVCIDQLNALVEGLRKAQLWAISSKYVFFLYISIDILKMDSQH